MPRRQYLVPDRSEIFFAADRDVISSNPQSLEAFESLRKHLDFNRVNRNDTSVVLGPWLRLDPRTGKFVGETATDRANGLLTREYRKPFVVPEKV